MEIAKWQNVVIEWVNCLKISSSIQSLSELKNEEFFRKLLSLINNGNVSTECISLPDFLKKHYPFYHLDTEPTLVKDDFEICNVCSLLLYYCCVVDGRPQFTSPMCKTLSTPTQLRVKSFLEVLQISEKVTREMLSLAVLNIDKHELSPKKKETPLVDYFRTPHKKGLESHRQHVKQLESQLELQRYERDELQEELTLQQERNRKLDKTVLEKQAEISHLKAELLALETGIRTPPASAKKDGRLEARRLRQELVSLEKYVQTLNAEQEQVQIECTKAQNKARELEQQVSFWRSEAESATSDAIKLREAHAGTQAELAAAQERCDELSSLLAEFRPQKPTPDDSLEAPPPYLNHSGSIDNENLARTVVDLQLIDAQEENTRLRDQIVDLESQITQNESFCSELKSTLSDTQFNLNYFKNENETLTLNLKKHRDLHETLNEQLNEKIKQFDILICEKQSIQEKLDISNKFSQKFDEIFAEIAPKYNLKLGGKIFDRLEEMVQMYENKFVKHENSIEDYQKKVNQLQDDLNFLRKNEKQFKKEEKKLRELVTNTKTKLKTLQEELNFTLQQNDDTAKIYENKIQTLESKLEHNQKTIQENILQICESEKNVRNLIQQKSELENNLLQKNSEIFDNNEIISKLNQKSIEYKTSIEKLEEKVSNMTSNLENSQTHIHNLQKQLEDNNTIIENYKDVLEEKTQNIKDLNSKITTLQCELKHVEDFLAEEKTKKVTLQQKCESLSSNLQKLESIVEDLSRQKAELEETVISLNIKIITHEKSKQEMEEKCEKLNKIISDIESQMKLLEDDNLILNQQLQTLNKNEELASEIDKLNIELEKAQISNNNYKEKLEKMTVNLNEKSEILSELQNKKTLFNEQIKSLEDEIYEINEQKNKLETNLEKMSLTLQEKQTNFLRLEAEKLELEQQLDVLKKTHAIQNTELLDKLSNYETSVKTSTDTLKIVSEDVSRLITTISKENLNVLLQNETDLFIKLSDLETNIYALISDRRLLQSQTMNLKQNISDNNQKISDLTERNNALEYNLQTNKSNLKNYQKKLTEVEKKLDKTMENTEILLQNHKKEISDQKNQISQLKNDLEIEKQKNSETSIKNQQSLIESVEKIEKLQFENSQYQKTIQNLQDTLQEKDDFILKLDQKIQEFNLESDSYHKDLSLADKFAKIDKFCTDSVNKFISLYTLVFDSSFEVRNFDKLFNEILAYKTKLQKVSDLQLEIAKCNKDLSEKQIDCKKYNEEIILLKTTSTNWQKIAQDTETQNKKLQNDYDCLHQQLQSLKTAYSKVLKENSQLQLDCTVLRTTLDERNTLISNLTLIKDSYEKLLEENNKLHTELDTIKYKRTRDKDEFKRILNDATSNNDQQIQQVRNEYEDKLKKMKDKIVKLYREEVEKEKKKVCTLQQGQSEDTIASLKSQLWLTGNKYTDLKREYDTLRSRLSQKQTCDRKAFTLPRDTKVEVIHESVSVVSMGLAMEDEQGELFNNTYLADLKAGRCEVDTHSSNSSSRLSELQFRNSLCPPHLKSSYPAETQYEQIQEDEIKLGAVNQLDDSMSSKLLPGDRPRNRKDFGQTLYKKPGPPTPSKNGGRLSLQGNEVLRESNKQAGTPSRLKALFSRSARDQENVSSSTPRSQTKRRSIFRR